MEYTVYALKSTAENYIYVGMTQDFERRFHEHNSGYVRSTSPHIPFRVLYTEKVGSRIQARIREKHLKSGAGKEFLRMFL